MSTCFLLLDGISAASFICHGFLSFETVQYRDIIWYHFSAIGYHHVDITFVTCPASRASGVLLCIELYFQIFIAPGCPMLFALRSTPSFLFFLPGFPLPSELMKCSFILHTLLAYVNEFAACIASLFSLESMPALSELMGAYTRSCLLVPDLEALTSGI